MIPATHPNTAVIEVESLSFIIEVNQYYRIFYELYLVMFTYFKTFKVIKTNMINQYMLSQRKNFIIWLFLLKYSIVDPNLLVIFIKLIYIFLLLLYITSVNR